MSTYIMRWNPAISSSKIDRFREAKKKWPNGFCGNWSIYEWQEAHEGDSYIMVRVGDGPNGMVYYGEFLSEPYEDSDWAGTSKTRRYVDISIVQPSDPDRPSVPIERLEEILPEIEWRRGHSGQLLTDDQERRLWEGLNML